jgi:hypothetical protein
MNCGWTTKIGGIAMAKKKVKMTGGTMRVKVWPVLTEAVDNGIMHGWNRAHKHVSNPDEAAIRQAIADAVTSEIAEVFDIEDNHGE